MKKNSELFIKILFLRPNVILSTKVRIVMIIIPKALSPWYF